MTPEQLLQEAREDGVVFVLKGDAVSIFANAEIRDGWAEVLRPYKAHIVRILKQEQAQQSQLAIAQDGAEDASQPSRPTMPGVVDLLTSEHWRSVRDAYHDHHHNCPVCIAAGKGYGLRCGAGTSLWAAYQSACTS